MSSAAGLILLLALAQHQAPVVDTSLLTRLVARADSLRTVWREADALADLADSLAHRLEPPVLDSFAAGSLRVLANPSPLQMQAAVERAWRVLDSAYGVAAGQVTTAPVQLMTFDPKRPLPGGGRFAGHPVAWDIEQQDLVNLIIGAAAKPRPATRFREWLMTEISPFMDGRRTRSAAYVELVTAPFELSRECFRGDLARCALGMGLPSGDDPVGSQYLSPAERRLAVARLGSVLDDAYSGNAAAYDECLAGGDGACRALLCMLPARLLPRPLGVDSRLTVVQLALRLGGRGAFQRLLDASDGPPGGAILAAAGVPLDSLLGQWHREVIASRPAPVTVTIAGAVTALGWTLLISALSLRSSRWRAT